ncbi:MAG TPA: SagB family peptide dehydrogenase [Pseudonocardiaceae bacterium]|nr:SagB family peptide dehydrogenase [Pseudonocardiaceae bacterium]
MPHEPADGTTARIELWSLREDVLVEDSSGHDELVAVTKWAEIRLDGADETVRESLRRMSLGPVSLANVVTNGPRDGVLSDSFNGLDRMGDRSAWANLLRVLDLLSGSVVRSLGLSDGDSPLLSAVPIAPHASFRPARVDDDQPVRLSRFAAIRAMDGEVLLESPLAAYHVVLHRHLAATVVMALSGPTTVGEIADVVGTAPDLVADVLGYLVATGIVLVGEWIEPPRPDQRGQARFAEDEDPTLTSWSYHDLLFHSRSRMGRYGGQSGVVFPHADTHPSPDLVKPVRSGRRFQLYRPRIADLIAADPPLTEVLENTRHSTELTGRRLTADEVGELLFRTARIRSVSSGSTGSEVRYDISDRPYLSVHGLYELELYVSAHNCVGLPRGTYHYDPEYHTLTLVNDSALDLDELLDNARVAAGSAAAPSVLVTMTARVARFSWMYGGIGYSLTLAHVGALQQTLCLVANAMGLAACAPAVDPDELLDSALQLGWPAEVGVGEFLVG